MLLAIFLYYYIYIHDIHDLYLIPYFFFLCLCLLACMLKYFDTLIKVIIITSARGVIVLLISQPPLSVLIFFPHIFGQNFCSAAKTSV